MPKKQTSKKKNVKNLPLQGIATQPAPASTFFIVAVGASAGGLETLREVFAHAGSKINMAFIIITHLLPHKASLLPELLQQFTEIKVLPITNELKVEPNHIYVLPPDKNALIDHGTLFLVEPETNEARYHPIDFFLRSLAKDQGKQGICVILSGTGNDGTYGLRNLREQGGLIIVQTAKSARYDGMPKSAINTGLVDYTLPPQKILPFLIDYAAHAKNITLPIQANISDEIQEILSLLHDQTSHDFSLYKQNTIFRRIQKRLGILHLDTVGHYLEYLHQHPSELQLLFKELLINVTNFFRDPLAFDMLKKILFNTVLVNKSKHDNLRVWVPGCSTGEEAYSIAIILQECMDSLRQHFNIQIFGTDIDAEAIEIARAGVFPLDISKDVTPNRLNRFFVKEDNTYKINIDIRKMIIFAEQNIIKDPPFTQLDLLSCRNLLIYLGPQLQRKILPLFHYSLVPNGILFLGTSETIGGSTDLFSLVDRRWKIFQRKDVSSSFKSILNLSPTQRFSEIVSSKTMEKISNENNPLLTNLVEKILLECYTPACVVIDENEKIIYAYGRTGKFIEFASGEIRLNFLDMVRPELKTKLMAAIRKATEQHREEILSGVQLKEGQEFIYINVKVRPITIEAKSSPRILLLIIFEEVLTRDGLGKTRAQGSKEEQNKKIVQLEQELKYTKESLQTTIEELETSNEELKSSNEELQSTNEELQSTNEEIETSKEELQSLNEELTTVNAELESRIEQLSSANDDIKNLLDNTEIATIFLDKDLCIKRFTPKATDIINLIPADVGRPLSHIVTNLQYDKLIEDAHVVLKTLKSKMVEVIDKCGHWLVVKIIPYRTVTNINDGVVITFLNIHAQKKAENELMQAKNELKITQETNHLLLNAIHSPAILLDNHLKVIMANAAFNTHFNKANQPLSNQNLFKLNGELPKGLKPLLEKMLVEQAATSSQLVETANGKKIELLVRNVSGLALLLTFSFL